MNFTEKLIRTCRDANSLLCVGLDTQLEKIPSILQTKDDPIFQFNKAIIDATHDLVAAYKLNIAFYEAHGIAGWGALKKTVDYIPAQVIKIADAKRGDIANTSRMYAQAFFDHLGFDAVTVNPYLGGDSVQPFIAHEDKGAFFLSLTSNPGSQDFQHFSDGQKCLYEVVAERVVTWNRKGNCGLVVGATHPRELKRVREIAPMLPLLVPGIGAQGGDVESAVIHATNEKGELALFNSSRGIIYASSGPEFSADARNKALELKTMINNICNKKIHPSSE